MVMREDAKLDNGPDYLLEASWPKGSIIIGVDEAGRGPWAGPVVAAAFWINPSALLELPPDLTDSKKLSPAARTRIAATLRGQPHLFAIGSCSSAEIDENGLLPATFAAMDQAVAKLASQLASQLAKPVTAILVDGNLLPPLPATAKAVDIRALVKGDARSLSIAAASIMAKTERDKQMQALDGEYPGYGFSRHKGYGTKAHLEALKQLGPCAQHRRSFRPIRELLLPQ